MANRHPVRLMIMTLVIAICAATSNTALATADPSTVMDQQLVNDPVEVLAETAYGHISEFVATKVSCELPRQAVLDDIDHPFVKSVLEDARRVDPLGVYLTIAIKAAKFIGTVRSGCPFKQVTNARSACIAGNMVQAFIDSNNVTVSSASSLGLRATIYTAFDDQIASMDDAKKALESFVVPAGVAGYDIGTKGQSCNLAGGKVYVI